MGWFNQKTAAICLILFIVFVLLYTDFFGDIGDETTLDSSPDFLVILKYPI